MESFEETIKTESEEDDYENFFLQPAISPYNMIEKVQQANEELFNANYENFERKQKVKFDEEKLVNYEPDLTDDDVQSIESYNEVIDYSLLENNHSYMEELKYIIPNKEIAMFDIDEEIEDESGIVEEIIEEIQQQEIIDEISHPDVLEMLINNNINDNNDNIVLTRPKSAKKCFTKYYHTEINCKRHCIEEFESTLDLCISKLNISEKPVCPTLKLQKRGCCEKNQIKSEHKLPLYTGCRSEYGLSSLQIERREKRKEIIKLKEQKRQTIQDEYRKRKIQQNELIFCQWLKDISNRKIESDRNNKWSNNYNLSPKQSVKLRPKTADCINNNVSVKKQKRPHTSTATVFIEIPESILRKGIRVGDLLVNQKKIASKQLHLLGLC